MLHLQTFLEYREHEGDLVIAVEQLREAAWVMSSLIGDGTDQVEVEEILGEM